jgi:DNA-binding LacI/PurR family transcriptional regulator
MAPRTGVSLRDIAKALNISTAAASKALNDLPGVSDALRLRVKQTAEAMGYQKYLRSSLVNAYERSMKFVAVLYGRIGGHLIEQIQFTIDEKIRRKGYFELRYLIDVSKELQAEDAKELFLRNIVKEKGVVGILSCYIKLSDVLIDKLREHQIPVVLLENHTDFGRCVTIDNVKASYRATAKLVELGRRRIGCIMPQEEVDHVWRDRLEGYKHALKDKGLAYDPGLIVYENLVGMDDSERATQALLGKRPDVNAILFGSDRQAYGGMKKLKAMGKRIPQDVAVIGFDDLEFNTIVEPPLSSVRQPIRKMADVGLGMLFDSIENKDLSHRSVVLDTELVLRGSC